MTLMADLPARPVTFNDTLDELDHVVTRLDAALVALHEQIDRIERGDINLNGGGHGKS